MYKYDLGQFFGGYFHQDWNDDYATYEDAISDFLAHTSPEHLAIVIRELDELLSRGYSDSELAEVAFKEYTCYYYPYPGGIGMYEWLRRVLQLLKAAKPSPGPRSQHS